MAKDRTNFAEEGLQRGVDAASFGANWMAELTDHNMKQGMAAMDGMLQIVQRAMAGFGHQASMVREQSVTIAEEAMENAAQYGHRIVHLKDPLEWAEVQSEFLSRQAKVFAEGNKKLSEKLIRETGEMAHAAMNEARRRSEAAE